MSDLLPLFPLPNVVLFPSVFLPLHIFEPRYREMVADALASDRMIGMVLLRPGWDRDYEGRPPIYPIGCSGVMTHVERLTDGRFNIVLRGLERFRIVEENHDRTYRHERTPGAADRDEVRQCRAKLESLLAPASGPDWRAPHLMAAKGRGEGKIPTAMSDEDLVNALAQYLDLEPLEKQALLEQPSLRNRAVSLVELLEMKVMIARTPGVSNVAH
jgi:Lon protease-like protein